MSEQTSKRKYRNSLDFVESGFHACRRNAQDLVSASQKLIEGGLHAPALSLAVLALEELGKLVTIDGLLYARYDDQKAETFAKAGKGHSAKLTILQLFPLLLASLSRLDPRFNKEQRYTVAWKINELELQKDGDAVMAELQEGGFPALDSMKQQGFYVSASDRRFIAPCDVINPSFAKAVHKLAWRATTTLDFVLKGGNLERYIENARSVRASLTEEQHLELERLGHEQFTKTFNSPTQS